MQEPPGTVPPVTQDPAQTPGAVAPPANPTPPVRPGDVPAGVPKANAPADASVEFLNDFNRIVRREIEFSRVAVKMARARDVREFAQRVISGHAALGERLSELALEWALKLTTPERPAEAELRRLRETSVMNFDARYLELIIADHERALELIAEFPDEGESELRRFVEEQETQLRGQLKDARKIHTALPRP